mmetsp:Transcript_3491/g.5200  ORF Transcript_3491/g.5200 Transcript_3491/m.5200 type:complete len:111 (+) Transcript_3491:424-756(+)
MRFHRKNSYLVAFEWFLKQIKRYTRIHFKPKLKNIDVAVHIIIYLIGRSRALQFPVRDNSSLNRTLLLEGINTIFSISPGVAVAEMEVLFSAFLFHTIFLFHFQNFVTCF